MAGGRWRGAAYDAVVTVELARDRPETLYADTLGAAWLAVAGRILADGIAKLGGILRACARN